MAVELDPALAGALRGRWLNVRVVEGDAVVAPLPAERFRVVSNLPFARTNDLLHRLLDDPAVPLERADLVVEWGVACKRGLPWPSSVNGVVWAAFYELSVARRLPRHAFRPPPSVEAGVLVCRRRETPLVPAARVADYRRFVATGFRRGLRMVATPDRLRQVAATGTVLARDLDAHNGPRSSGKSGHRRAGGGQGRVRANDRCRRDPSSASVSLRRSPTAIAPWRSVGRMRRAR